MNKLILIGNGFDLAHDLPTSYKHFLNDFWKNIHLNYKKEEYQNFIYIDEYYFRILNFSKEIESFEDFEENIRNYKSYYNDEFHNYLAHELRLRNNSIVIQFKNDFFKLINAKNSIENWVDIENEYYIQLKKITKLKLDNSQEEKLISARKEKVIKLNKEFEDVKNLLIKYLREKILQEFNVEKISTKEEFLEMYKIFKPNSSLNKNEWNISEFSTLSDSDHISKIYEEEKINNRVHCYSYIANFNYTDTAFLYFWEMNKSLAMENGNINSIHGEIDSEDFKPVFGFGDEMDEEYQLIEDLDDNEYLKFFKSFQYFQNNCYDNLLREIDGEKFQVCVLGHSCGLSDRVLLNTIFEHENCRSIKIYYHQKKDGSDNYLDVVKNISRHFKDKPSMRRKIVSKKLSSTLPQNVRFKKIEKKE